MTRILKWLHNLQQSTLALTGLDGYPVEKVWSDQSADHVKPKHQYISAEGMS